MANQLLFKRVAKLAIAIPDPASFNATRQSSVIMIEDLRFQFKVKKTRIKDPNLAEIVISNLSEKTRGEIQSKALKIVLEAGYEQNFSTIFTGDVRDVTHRHEGPDWSTHIVAGDGERAVQFARINDSFKAGVKTSEILKKIAAALKIDPGNTLKAAAAIDALGSQFTHGYSARGKAANELTRLLNIHGYEWSIQDGKLQILKRSESLTNVIIELNNDTGLVGAPEFGAPEKKGEAPYLKLKALLQPQLRPGALVKVSSETIKGTFRIDQVIHTGDTSGNDWYSEIEARPL